MKTNKIPQDSSLRRGRAAENRLVEILRSLRKDVPWIGKVRLASIKFDQTGVDVLVSVKPLEGICNIKVPIQVKSSQQGVLSHTKKYPTATKPNLLVVVVNDSYSDEQLKKFLKEKLDLARLGRVVSAKVELVK